MSAIEPQVVDPQEFIAVLDYQFSGNDVTVDNKRRFLAAYFEHGTITHAAAAIGINRKTAHHYINTDPLFAEALAHTHEDCADMLESSVYKRAFKDSILAMFWLKAYRPRFRDRMTVDVDDLREQVRESLASMRSSREPHQSLQISSESDSKQKD